MGVRTVGGCAVEDELEAFYKAFSAILGLYEAGCRRRVLVGLLWRLLRDPPEALKAALSQSAEKQIEDWLDRFDGDPLNLMLDYTDPAGADLTQRAAQEMLAKDAVTLARWVDAEAFDAHDLTIAKYDQPERQCREPLGTRRGDAFYVFAAELKQFGRRKLKALDQRRHLCLAELALPQHQVVCEGLAGGFRARVWGSGPQASWRAPPGPHRPLRFGGAVFRGLKLEPQPRVDGNGAPDGFWIHRLASDAYESELRDHLDRAIHGPEALDVLGFPECAIDARGAETVAAALKARDSQGAPALTVAGSWHREDPLADYVYRNAAPVFDQYGEKIADIHKTCCYTDPRSALEEAIEPGWDYHIFYLKGHLVSVMICKDFCNPERSARVDPVLNLPVDGYFVISMGDEATLTEHAMVAHWLYRRALLRSVRPPPRAFVIQQPPEPVAADPTGAPSGGAWGYALYQHLHRIRSDEQILRDARLVDPFVTKP